MPAAVRELDRLAAILARLDSPYDGERAAAALLASREVRRLGLSWRELLAPSPPPSLPWGDLVAHCQQQPALLTTWEVDFLADLRGFKVISDRQRARLMQIVDRIGMPTGPG